MNWSHDQLGKIAVRTIKHKEANCQLNAPNILDLNDTTSC